MLKDVSLKINGTCIRKVLLNISFFVCLFCISRQFPFKELAILIIPSLFGVFIFSYKELIIHNHQKRNNNNAIIYYANALILLLMLIYAVVINQTDIIIAVRFFFIFLLVVSAYYMPPNRRFIDIFILLSLLQAIVLIGIECYAVLNKDLYNSGVLRAFFNNPGFGDVYTFDGNFFRVQLLGNSILPVAYYIGCVYLEAGRHKVIILALLLAAIIIAGNFAFMIATIIFTLCYWFGKSKITYDRLLLLMLGITVIFAISYNPAQRYLLKTLELKKEVSLATRNEQVHFLIDDLTIDNVSLLLGRGLGNTISVSGAGRDYTGAYNYELQTVYLLNQTGIIYFSVFIIFNLILTYVFIYKSSLLLIYSCYIIYAVTNPYMFDSVHIILIMVLVSLRKVIDEKDSTDIIRCSSKKPSRTIQVQVST